MKTQRKATDIVLITRQTTVPNSKATGALARTIRTDVGLSLREVARRMKVSAMYLSQLERGQRNWTERLLIRYRAAVFPPRHTNIPADHWLLKHLPPTGTPDAPDDTSKYQ